MVYFYCLFKNYKSGRPKTLKMFPWTSLRIMKECHIDLIGDEKSRIRHIKNDKSSRGQIHSLVRPE